MIVFSHLVSRTLGTVGTGSFTFRIGKKVKQEDDVGKEPKEKVETQRKEERGIQKEKEEQGDMDEREKERGRGIEIIYWERLVAT